MDRVDLKVIEMETQNGQYHYVLHADLPEAIREYQEYTGNVVTTSRILSTSILTARIIEYSPESEKELEDENTKEGDRVRANEN